MSMHEKLLKIQQELKVPKNRLNKFGGYHYRSCEDIVEAVKPLCAKHNVVLTLSDTVKDVGGRVFICTTAILTDIELGDAGEPVSMVALRLLKDVRVTGWAEIAAEKKGMDVAQITGAASSYARKYALNGLFAIDDVQDADATNGLGNGKEDWVADATKKIEACATLDELKAVWESLPANVKAEVEDAKEIKKQSLS